MKGEILIIAWIAVVALVGSQVNYKRTEFVNGSAVVRCVPLFAIIAFLPVILWAGFRPRYGFADTSAYVTMYLNLPEDFNGLREYLATIDKDKGFYLLSGIIKMIFGSNYRPFLLISAVFQGACIIKFYRNYSPDYIMSIFLFIISADYYAWMMNGIRQFLAVTIIYFAISLLVRKKYILFCVVVLIAATVHQTAIIMIPIALIVQGKPWNKKTLLMIAMALLAVFFTNQFTSLLNTALEDTAYSANATEMAGQAGVNPLRVAVYAVPAALAFVGRKKLDKENNQVINISVNMSIITLALYLIAMVTSGIMMGRLPIYTSLFNYILLPYEIEHIFDNKSRLFLRVALVLLYMAYYYYLMHFAYGRI